MPVLIGTAERPGKTLGNGDARPLQAASALRGKTIRMDREESYDAALIRPRSHEPRPALFPVCSNPQCGTGWLRLWRSRRSPVFEGGWCCSAACTEALVDAALRRELSQRVGPLQVHRHRVPLGLAMLEQGWIAPEVLRRALQAQRAAASGRIGYWLRRQGVSETAITRALALQWSCPVLPVEAHDPGGLSSLFPRLFVDAFGALPLRLAAEKILYLGFEDRLDPVLALAVERMADLHVESGMVEESRFRRAHAQALEARYPGVELVEAASEQALARSLARSIERAMPVETKLVRVHDCVWLRMWLQPQFGAVPAIEGVRDVIGSVSGSRPAEAAEGRANFF